VSTRLIPPTDQNSFLAGIGHICLQWANIEQLLLGILAAVDGIPLAKAYTRYGGTDMMPRLNLAVALTEEAKWPRHLTQKLRDIRKEIQRNNGLADRRNMFVHGAHERTEVDGEYALTMSRWKGDKQRQIVTIVDAAELANRLSQLAQDTNAVHVGYGNWKFGLKNQTYSDEDVSRGKTIARGVRAHNIKRAVKLLFANLKPW
jgi:hypothetical protein